MRCLSALAALAIVILACGCLRAGQVRAEEPRSEPAPQAKIRPPAVAGQFYPGSADELERLVRQFLERAHPPAIEGKLIGLICPHAGYQFSGPTAAHAYKVLQGREIKLAVIIGPSHHTAFPGALLTESAAWRTPLGSVEVDRQAVKELLQAAPDVFRCDDAAQGLEHSVEVQLPFLQVVAPGAKIVPIVMHDFSRANCAAVGRAVAKVVSRREGAIIIASTDLAHYPPTELCRKVDAETIRRIVRLDIDGIYAWERRATEEYADRNVACTMCGLGAVVAEIVAAKQLGATKAVKLHYTNSGMVEPLTAARSVGYLAAAIVAPAGQASGGRGGGSGTGRQAQGVRKMEQAPVGSADNLTDEQKKRLLRLARRAIEEWVRNGRRVEAPLDDPAFREPRAVFVTLKINGRLRGCIGTLEPVAPLAKAVVDSAISAATQDPRFFPVTEDELDKIDIHISVLSPLRPVRSVDEIVLGKHGIVVQSGLRKGVFLPEVPIEQGWDLETTLSILCVEKAGLPADAWRRGAQIYVFTTQSFGEEDYGMGPHAK